MGGEMDRLQAMQTLVRVVELGSFSAAARELGEHAEEQQSQSNQGFGSVHDVAKRVLGPSRGMKL